ncbi:MAG: F0F1 ATP synthase subunit alpha, partial [Kutzneria sp.]|nr:F0F1 ATP synthase subunit alpha [Kutzneria sp.]
IEDVRRFESEFLDHLRRNAKGILTEIASSGDLSGETEERLTNEIEAFKAQFAASDGSSVVNDPEAKAMDADKVEHESVKVSRPAPAKK